MSLILYGALSPGVRLDGSLAGAIKGMAAAFAAYGGNGVLWPPLRQTGNPFSFGYDPRRDLDVGQWPGRPLNWGTAQGLLEANNALHEAGLLALEDWVIHQYGGEAPLYETGSDGQVDKTLFPKVADCFVPNVPVDQVFDPVGNSADGMMVSYQHSKPAGYMLEGKRQAGVWADAVLGLDGWRADDGKGEAVDTLKALWAGRPGLVVAEVYSGDPGELASFVEQTGMAVLDFPRHFAYRSVSQGASLRVLPGNGFCFRDPGHAWVFVDNFDTDGASGVINNKLWFYLDALTVPAKATLIYAGDYEGYGLAPFLENMMWFASTFAKGLLVWEFVDDSLIAWSRDGEGGAVDGWSGGCLCGYSTDPVHARTQWVHTPFAPGTPLHDYAGHGPDLHVNAHGWVECVFGANAWGAAQNYVMYAPAGVSYRIPRPPVGRKGTGAFRDFRSITVRL